MINIPTQVTNTSLNVLILCFYTGKRLSELRALTTSAPTKSAKEVDFWYPIYGQPWINSDCSNKLPLHFDNINDRPNNLTKRDCCKADYGIQVSIQS